MKKYNYLFFKTILLLAVILFISQTAFADTNQEIVKAKVIKVDNKVLKETTQQQLTLIIQQGKFKGQECTINRQISSNSKYDFLIRENSSVYIYINTENEKPQDVSLAYISREDIIYKLFLVFFIALLILGSFKGIRSGISLVITFIVITNVFIPMVIKGQNPIIVSVMCSLIIIIVSFILINGFGTKTKVAIMGTIAGTIIAGILAAYFVDSAYITGMSNDEIQFIVVELGKDIDFKGVLFSGIIFGSLGAVMDVSMSISSFMNELQHQKKRLSFGSLFISGYSVGKDIMATMVNTLILAYVGTSLPLFLLMAYTNMNAVKIINNEAIAIEIIRSLCGSMGLMLTIPVTAFIGAIAFSRR